MSNNKMLIDATHPEETRVVVLRGGRVEEFDYESAARKLLRGNIYLAKVTRVEPSLQAAFVDYGGNRHGFLAFNEIHPDYYQIPFADRQALLDEEARAEAEEEAAADARAEAIARRREAQGATAAAADNGSDDALTDEDGEDEPVEEREPVEDSDGGDAVDAASAADRDDHGDGHDGEASRPAARTERTGLVDVTISEPAEAAHAVEPQHDARDEPHASEPDAASDEASDRAGAADEGESAEARASDDLDVPAAETRAAPGEPGRRHRDRDREHRGGRHERRGRRGQRPGKSNGDNDQDGDGEGGVQEVAGGAQASEVEHVGSEDALEEMSSRPRPRRRTRSYKIQEVIKRRQVLLIQVVKEERGTKGAALTTYLSLAGRYTVLMPNTARGGGISRKISNPQDRKRLKAIAQELEVPEGMGLIIRTAGAARTKQEIKRDFEYLLRLWESVRDLTLRSEAPSLVYEEGNLIKRSIRDLYNKDVDEIIVAGAEAHAEARDFMRMLMPSHAKNVIEYTAPEPLFTRYGIERQLNAMFSPYVTLRSGGYLVINQTEALVAVDVNSGKSTREFSIEETALNTNLEAADEIARQVKLRDLAGLIVIDFIDMEEKRNNRAVERRLKDALRFDRARIQLGRISHFGLMEMSRQRLRTGVLEGSTTQCPHCQGTGIIRSTESVALAVLRGLEDAVMAGARTPLVATTTATVALYILNNKRGFIIDMERRLGHAVSVQGSDKLQGANFTIEKGAAPAVTALRRTDRAAVNMDWGFDGDEEEQVESTEAAADAEDAGDSDRPVRAGRPESVERDRDGGSDRDEGGRRRRRKRRRGRRGERGEGEGTGAGGHGFADREPRDDDDDDEQGEGDGVAFTGAGQDRDEAGVRGEADESETYEGEATGDDDEAGGEPGEGRDEASANGEPRRRRRRGRRGGRRNRERREGAAAPGLEPQPYVGGEPRAEFDDTGSDHGPDDGADDDGAREVAVTGAAAEPTAAGERGAAVAQPPRSEPERAVRIAEPEPELPLVTSEPPANSPPTAEVAQQDIAPEVPRHRLRASSEPSEPKLERVVVRADQGGEAAPAAAESERPARKGWWSRRFGGE